MYCPKCGAENPDGAQLCQSCSWVLTSVSKTAISPDAKTSGLAITALVLAILSFFTLFLTAIPALIFGIVSLVKIEKSAGQLKGKGLAITGIALPAVALPIVALGIMMPALFRVRQLAQRMLCGTMLKGLGNAIMIYSNDYNDKYPTADKWCDLLLEGGYVTEKQFKCLKDKEGPCNYAMNKNIEKLGTNSPPDMVLLFETISGWNQSGGPEILTTGNHQDEGCNVLFVDGHVEFIRTENLDDLKWTAE